MNPGSLSNIAEALRKHKTFAELTSVDLPASDQSLHAFHMAMRLDKSTQILTLFNTLLRTAYPVEWDNIHVQRLDITSNGGQLSYLLRLLALVFYRFDVFSAMDVRAIQPSILKKSVESIALDCNLARTYDGQLKSEDQLKNFRLVVNGSALIASAYHHGDDQALARILKTPDFEPLLFRMQHVEYYRDLCDRFCKVPIKTPEVNDTDYLAQLSSLDQTKLIRALESPERTELIEKNKDFILASMFQRQLEGVWYKKKDFEHISKFVSRLLDLGVDWYAAYRSARHGFHEYNILKSRIPNLEAEGKEVFQGISERPVALRILLSALPSATLTAIATETVFADKLYELTENKSLMPLMSRSAVRKIIEDGFDI